MYTTFQLGKDKKSAEKKSRLVSCKQDNSMTSLKNISLMSPSFGNQNSARS